MSLTDGILLTLFNSIICLVFPKLISSVFGAKRKPLTLCEKTAIALEKAS